MFLDGLSNLERVPNPRNMCVSGKQILHEIQDSGVKFTNFSIAEILRPDFGAKSDNSEVLNLRIRPNLANNGQCSENIDNNNRKENGQTKGENSKISSNAECATSVDNNLYPAWVYCTRYSDRPSSGPRSRKIRRKEKKCEDDKRPRTAFTSEQLRRLQVEFETSRYLTESRRQSLSRDLNLSESQIKIWFQNKRAKIKKVSGHKNELAIQLIAQGLYNHKTAPPEEGVVKMER